MSERLPAGRSPPPAPLSAVEPGIMETTVFVSSRITGMQEFRSAARTAIEALSYRPLMAEDFAASTATPRGACLDGVRRSDVVVLILGEHYGEPQASGKSATEEEFDEARRLSRPIIVIKIRGPHDAQQAAFLNRLGDWASGSLFREVASRDDLIKEIVRALQEHQHAPGGDRIFRLVPKRLSEVVLGPRGHGSFHLGPRLSVAWVPAAPAGTVDEDAFFEVVPERVGDLIVSGPSRISDTRLHVRAGADRLTFQAPDARTATALCVVVWSDGSVAIGCPIRAGSSSSLSSLLIVPPSAVEDALARSLHLIRAVTAQVDEDGVIRQGGIQVCLENLGMAHLREAPPRTPGGGIPVRMPRGPEQLYVPQLPTMTSRADLGSPTVVARWVRQLQRASESQELHG